MPYQLCTWVGRCYVKGFVNSRSSGLGIVSRAYLGQHVVALTSEVVCDVLTSEYPTGHLDPVN
jgi:hypothetical protein